ncbi:MAG: hypothetical protein RRY79_00550 [Clostridia bacterium]
MFSKKECNENAITEFWKWFLEKESWIIENIKMDGMKVIDCIEPELSHIFPYCKKEVEFTLGYNNNKGEFFFYDLHNKYLNRDAKKLKQAMPNKLKENWNFVIEH